MYPHVILAARLLGLPLAVGLTVATISAGGQWPWLAVAALLFVGMGTEHLLGANAEAMRPRVLVLRRLNDIPVYGSALLLVVLAVAFAWMLGELAELTALEGVTAGAALAVAGAACAYCLCLSTAGAVVAHELIHRLESRHDLWLGDLVSAQMFDPSDPVEHVWGHHLHVGTWNDPSTARRGESFWAFLRRSVPGTLATALAHERQRFAAAGALRWIAGHRVLRCVGLMAGFAVLFAALGGVIGVILFLLAGVVTRLLAELIKYMAHYGLVRDEASALAGRHSWNAPQVSNAVVLLNSTWHSEHHVHGDLPHWRLRAPKDVPMVPYSTGLMALAALVPPVWFAVMREPLRTWDRHFASDRERALIAERSA